MSGRYLLDTNIVIALFANEQAVVQRFERLRQVFLPAAVVGELLYGALRSGRVRSNVARVEMLAATSMILSCDLETARHYGRIKNRLRQKGRPLPENDIWIAALAQQHRLTLVSRDAHFSEVERLRVKAWWERTLSPRRWT